MNQLAETATVDVPLLPILKHQQSSTSTRQKYQLTGGTLALIFLIFAWVVQAEVSKSLQHGSKDVQPYNKPFFISMLNQSCMVSAFLLNGFFLTRKEFCSLPTYLANNGLSVYTVSIRCVQLGFIYCASTFLWFSSLGHNSISVSIASGIYNSSVVWVFLLGIFFRLESFTWAKGGGVLLAIVGVALSSITSSSHSALPSANSSSPSSSLPLPSSPSSSSPSSSLPLPSSPSSVLRLQKQHQGFTFQFDYLQVVGSAMLYACFEVLLKLVTNAAQHKAGRSKHQDVPMAIANIFTGGVGVVHLFVLSWLFWPLNHFGWETFEWPSSAQWHGLVLNAGMGTIFNISFVASITLMSPALVSVSCLLTIPIAAITDLLLNASRDQSEQVRFTAVNVIGLCLICSGFVAFTVHCGKKGVEEEEEEEEGEEEEEDDRR